MTRIPCARPFLQVLRALQQPPHGRDAASTMFARMMEDIEADHALLLAWADERVQLAQTASDLVEHYLERVDGDVAMFDEEIRSTEVFMDEFEDLGAFTPREAPLSSRGRSTPAPVEMPALPPAPSGGRSSSQANDASMPRSNSRSAQPAQVRRPLCRWVTQAGRTGRHAEPEISDRARMRDFSRSTRRPHTRGPPLSFPRATRTTAQTSRSSRSRGCPSSTLLSTMGHR